MSNRTQTLTMAQKARLCPVLITAPVGMNFAPTSEPAAQRAACSQL